MSEAHAVTSGDGNAVPCDREGNLGAADFLYLAAAPTFAIMALLTFVAGSGSPAALCSSASPLSGMVPMYLLMSAFHLAPWLKLISHRRNVARQC
jgi:hypothetical protein